MVESWHSLEELQILFLILFLIYFISYCNMTGHPVNQIFKMDLAFLYIHQVLSKDVGWADVVV